MQVLDIILFAVIAAFLVLRLRNVLGRRSGHHQDLPRDLFGRSKGEGAKAEREEKIITLPDRSDAEAPEERRGRNAGEGPAPLAEGLAAIQSADPSFDDKEFASGAKVAFEMIINAFAEGDVKTLRPLLSNDVYSDFAGAIEARKKAGETLQTTLVGFTEAAAVEAELQGRTAFVTMKFVTEQINVTRDANGEVIEGDPNHVTSVTDLWTFARNTRSRDPNWTLVATQSPN